jgi:hypothetical protein
LLANVTMKWMPVLVVTLFMFSCKKEKTNNTSLVGKWKLTGIYQGYTMGGCFCWVDIPSAYADQLEFLIMGKYKLTKSLLASSTGCSGNYRVLTDSTIAITYDCQADPTQEITRKYSRTFNELIIDYQRIEGVVRYKYIRM